LAETVKVNINTKLCLARNHQGPLLQGTTYSL